MTSAPRPAATDGARREAALAGLADTSEERAYRAGEFPLEAEGQIRREAFFRAANLMNPEADPIFFDTTSTCFETEKEDGFRKYGHSKGHPSDRPQVTVAPAVLPATTCPRAA